MQADSTDPRQPEPEPRLKRLVGDATPWLAVLVALFALAGRMQHQRGWSGLDYYQFWLVGRTAHSEAPVNVWSAAERSRLGLLGLEEARRAQPPGRPVTSHLAVARARSTLETYSTPWLYTLAGVAASGRYGKDLAAFQHASLLALALAMALLARMCRHSWASSWLLLALAVTWFAPTISDFRVANVNRLQLGLLALHLWVSARTRLRGRHVWAGVVLGLAVTFKPNLAFPALALGLGWMVLGRWSKLLQQVGGALVGALTAVLLSSLWFGTASAWSWWSGVLSELMGEYDHAVSRGNFALARILDEYLGFRSAVSILVVLLALLGAALWSRRRALAGRAVRADEEVLEDVTLVALGAGISLFAPRLAWLHYFVLALPLAVLALRPGARLVLRAGGLIALVAVALRPLRDALGFREDQPQAALLVALGSLVLFVVVLIDLARPEEAPEVA